jgi:hypothetical protein
VIFDFLAQGRFEASIFLVISGTEKFVSKMLAKMVRIG